MPKIFVASPRDVQLERMRVSWAVRRLNGEFDRTVQFDIVRWEEGFYTADRTFQVQIDAALAECEIVVAILGMRIGTPVEDDFPRMPDGEPYPSGTAYEILASIASARRHGRPDVYVFFKDAATAFRVTRPDEIASAQEQWARLAAFRERWFEAPDGRSIGAYQTFDTPDAFEAKVEDLLRKWIRARHGDHPDLKWSVALRGSPFPGLEPFDARHADVFCGRNRKVARALEMLMQAAEGARAGRPARPFLLILGPSGAGKSSLMRAGLMPRLTRPGVVEGVDGWRVAVLRVGEGETLFDALARALLVAGGDDDPGGFGPALPELRGLGWTEPASLARLLETPAAEVPTRVVAAALDRAGAALAEREGLSEGTGVALLLLLDQLEELFVETVPPEARRTFANLLAALTDTRRIWAVATLRADVYGRLIAERSLIALTDRGAVYALAPPGADELEEIVRDSAERAGLAFETDAHGGRLDDRLLADASGGDALPLLQFTLSRLFERREAHGDAVRLTFAAYEAIGGVDGAIDQAGRTATEGFGPAEHAALERLLRALIVPIRDERTAAGGRTLALRAAPVDEAAPDPTTRRVADGLLRARILQASALEGGDGATAAGAPVATLRIAHERVLESWSQAREIVASNLKFFALRAEIDGQRQLWEAHARRPEYLIPPGAPIVEARAFAHDYADELSPELRAFVAASGWRETRRVRLRRALTGAFATLAVAASLLAAVALYWAGQARAVARTAKGTVTAVVTTFGTELAKLEGIPLRLVGRSLDEVRKLVENLRREIGDDDDLDRGRAAMLHSFASVYQKFSGLAAAETAARESLAIRSRLAARAPARGELEAELAETHDLLGDILRKRTPPDPAGALDQYGQAYEIRRRQAGSGPAGPGRKTSTKTWTWALSQSRIRLGDAYLERRQDGDRARAREEYQAALRVIAGLVLAEPSEDRWKRELSWAYRKLGTVEDGPAATAARANALCLRRVTSGRSDDIEWRRDLGFSLMDAAGDAARSRDWEGARTACFEAFELRRALIERDRDRSDLEADLAATLHQLGAVYNDEGKRPDVALAFFQAASVRRDRLGIRFPTDPRYVNDARRSEAEAVRLRERLRPAEPAGGADQRSEALIDEEARNYQAMVRFRQNASAGCESNLLAALPAVVDGLVAANTP